MPNQAVKWNVLPTPGSLSAQMLPSIISTSRLEMESPSPVPPYFRVVDVSAWENAWNSRALCSGVMPMPLSRTENFSLTRSASCSSSADRHQHLAALGELDGVVDQVDQDLAEAQRIADQVGRNVMLRGNQELEILVLGLLADDAWIDCRAHLQAGIRSSRCPACRPRSSRSRECR